MKTRPRTRRPPLPTTDDGDGVVRWCHGCVCLGGCGVGLEGGGQRGEGVTVLR